MSLCFLKMFVMLFKNPFLSHNLPESRTKMMKWQAYKSAAGRFLTFAVS